MATNVGDVNEVTEAIGGIAVAERPARHHGIPGLGDLHELPSRVLRSHLQRLPDAAPVITDGPLPETTTAPGFSALYEIPVGAGPIAAMSVDADGYLYVANPAAESIAVVDPVALSVVRTVTGVQEPFAVRAVNGRAYVSTVTGSNDAVSMIDTRNQSDSSYPVREAIRDIEVSADGRRVYAARTGRLGADIAVIETATGRVATVDLRTRATAAAEAISMSRDGSRVYVVTADHLGGEFIAVDTATNTVVGGLAFSSPLRDVAAGPDGIVFVASDTEDGGVVDVVDTRSLRVIDSMMIGGPITQLVAGTVTERLYVLNGDRITVVCPTTHDIIDTVTTVEQPSAIAESADGKRLFVSAFTGVVTVLTVASATESLMARMMTADVIDVPMLELEPTTA